MQKLFPLMAWTGLSMAIYQAVLVPQMTYSMPASWDDEKQLKYSALAQVGLGVGEVVGGYLNGEIEDKFGVKASFYANIVQFVLAFAALIAVTYLNEFTLWSATLMNLLWGLSDSGLNIFTECIAGFQF